MNELLAIALDAHGGLDRRNKLKGLTARMSISGPTWVIKGQPYLFNNVRIEMPLRERHMVTQLVGQRTIGLSLYQLVRRNRSLFEKAFRPERTNDSARFTRLLIRSP